MGQRTVWLIVAGVQMLATHATQIYPKSGSPSSRDEASRESTAMLSPILTEPWAQAIREPHVDVCGRRCSDEANERRFETSPVVKCPDPRPRHILAPDGPRQHCGPNERCRRLYSRRRHDHSHLHHALLPAAAPSPARYWESPAIGFTRHNDREGKQFGR
jgi:hypothetical protein